MLWIMFQDIELKGKCSQLKKILVAEQRQILAYGANHRISINKKN